MTEGEQVRDFSHVSQIANSLLEACDPSQLSLSPGKPEIHNLGSGNIQSLKEFANEQWQIFGGKGRIISGAIPYRRNEVFRYVPEVKS